MFAAGAGGKRTNIGTGFSSWPFLVADFWAEGARASPVSMARSTRSESSLHDDPGSVGVFSKGNTNGGMVAEPSAAQRVMSVLQNAAAAAARLLAYLAAKQELNEMKNAATCPDADEHRHQVVLSNPGAPAPKQHAKTW